MWLSVHTLATETKLLMDFEQPADFKAWEFKKASGTPSELHATHGKQSLKISADEYMLCFRFERDWSGYDALEMDIFVEGDNPVGCSTLIGDADWMKKSSYWNRHNGAFNLKPGANTVSFPVNGLYRGEAGSRGNDLKTNINPKEIARIDLGFSRKGAGDGALYIDNLRLVRESRPDEILAYDFGPDNQALYPGFTAIGPTTVYGKDGAKAGLRYAMTRGQARDNAFPTRLYQDHLFMAGQDFIVDVPNGKYHVWVMYDDCGYWGGETCTHRKRAIEAEGKPAWSEDRGADGPSDYLFHFENVEPRPGQNIWELYMKYLFTPRRFEVDVADGQLNLRFSADNGPSSKVSALIIYLDSKKAEAEAWVKEIEARNRKEFETRAIALGPKAPPIAERLAQTAIGYPALEQDLSFFDLPSKSTGKLERSAARGQRVSFTFSVAQSKDDAAEFKVIASPLSGPGGAISEKEIELRYVHHGAQRGFNDIAYTIAPETLRRIEGSGLLPEGGLTRQFWITVHVPDSAAPGKYSGSINVQPGGIRLDLAVNVLGCALDEPDFMTGFYGVHVPRELPAERRKTALRELFTVLRQSGMNTFSGGPNIQFKGLDANGMPLLDYGECDAFFKTARECGFTREVHAYGGPGMVEGLHGSYVIGETGREWEKKTGKPMGELLKIVWSAVRDHAAKENWLPIDYGFTDEPRVVEQAKEQLELMKLYSVHAPFVKIGGSYSVQWKDDPFNKAVQEIFKTLQWSALNEHTQHDMDKSKEFGRELWIYNQGRSRYSFGAYQWAEFHKGVRGRLQWHLLALHGYQFFNLDGREPDTAMINWGRSEIIPTLDLHRAREGVDDFRFAVTLWNLAKKNEARPEAKAALAWLEEISKSIPMGQSHPPKDFMDDESFRNRCVEHLKKLLP